MRQFVVPQFIQVENKVIGFITVRQFALLLGALFISIAFYKFADVTLFIFITVVDFGIAGTFGWLKVNGRPVHYFFINFIKNVMSPNRRVWGKDTSDLFLKERMNQKKEEKDDKPDSNNFNLKGSRLSELSLIVDTGGKYQGDIK
jgi:hypothetical protein